MTLRTIESEYSEKLISLKKEHFPIDLSLDSPIITTPHPRIIWCELLFKHKIPLPSPEFKLNYFFHESFKNLRQAQVAHPNVDIILGRPTGIHDFLNNDIHCALIDFENLGTVFLSRSEKTSQLSKELHHVILTEWLNYVLSPELWGENGKWIRFHERILTLFQKKNLILKEAKPGLYKLKSHASRLESLGFKGTLINDTYILVLPWAFSLSALNKLEDIILREF